MEAMYHSAMKFFRRRVAISRPVIAPAWMHINLSVQHLGMCLLNPHNAIGEVWRFVDEGESASARLPTRPGGRVYKTYMSFFWCGIAFSGSTINYAIGGALPFVGSTIYGLLAYVCALLITLVPVVLTGMPSFRYGVDTLDAVRTSFGVRGAVILLFGIFASSLGWMFILLALTARSFGTLVVSVTSASSVNEMYVIVFALVMLGVLWLLGCRGAAGMERVTAIAAPGQMLAALILLALLIHKYGLPAMLHTDVPASKAYTSDPGKSMAFAFEFGFDNVLTMLPFIGGLTRLVANRKDVMGPMVVGAGFIGAGFVAMVSCFAAVMSGTADPTIWVVTVGGPIFGPGILLFMLVANIGTMVIFLYIAAVATQQIRILTGFRLPWVIAIVLLPGIFLAFRTQWLLDHVIVFMNYIGIFFVGFMGVIVSDYFILRRQRIEPAHIFARHGTGDYWFWGGVNWFAVASAAFGSGLFLWMYDPVTLRTVGAFRYIGAGLPAFVATFVLYVVLMKLFVVNGSKGGYKTVANRPKERIEVAI